VRCVPRPCGVHSAICRTRKWPRLDLRGHEIGGPPISKRVPPGLRDILTQAANILCQGETGDFVGLDPLGINARGLRQFLRRSKRRREGEIDKWATRPGGAHPPYGTRPKHTGTIGRPRSCEAGSSSRRYVGLVGTVHIVVVEATATGHRVAVGSVLMKMWV
jgi:hypothetical protein